MTALRLAQGNTVDYTPVADVAAGDLVKFGTHVGVAENDIAAGRQGALAVNGIFRITGNAGVLSVGIGTELDVDLTEMEVVAPGGGDSDVKVFTAKAYDSVSPPEIDVWINKVG